MSSRREARERVMQALYAFEQGGGDTEHVLRHVVDAHIGDDATNRKFAHDLFLRVLDNRDDADELIGRHAENWDLARIALVDHLLLRIAVCELLTFRDIPPKVSINEAIEIAKRYSTDKSGRFINGVLDAALEELQREGRLRKSGRGLVGMESLGEQHSVS